MRTPALLTRTSTGPSSPGSTMRSMSSASATSPCQRVAVPPAASICGDDLLGPGLVGAVVDPHRPAVGGQHQRGRGADPARGAGHQGAALGRVASDTDAHRPSPLDHGRAPAEAGAEGTEQDAGAARAGAPARFAWASASGIVAAEVLPSLAIESITRSAVEAEPFADRAQDPRVGLVVDEEVDVVELEPGERRPPRSSSSAIRSTAYLKVSWPCMRMTRSVAVDLDQVGAGAVGAQDDRADAALQGAAHQHRAGAVGEDGGGGAIVGVGQGHHQVGADHENVDGAAGFDLAAGDGDAR